MRFCLSFLICPFLISLALAGCGSSNGGGPVDVAIIGSGESLSSRGVRLSPAAQHLRAATDEGLVAMDASGQIVPALAERWIVTDDGLSYIFRLRNSQWPNGDEITAGQVRRMLLDNLRRLDGTALGLDLAKINDVRAMTGKVIEIKLTGPMPDFLRLLAQPEMGFVRDGRGVGPMQGAHEDGGDIIVLTALPPDMRGLPALANWEETTRKIRVHALSAPQAVEAFASGEVDLVLNGRVSDLPHADTGPLSRGTIRIDAALGLLGLAVRNEEGLLAQAPLREALAMAIDRSALIQAFNIGGWQASPEVVPRSMWGAVEPARLRWASAPIEQRRAEARRRIAAWKAGNGGSAEVSIGMPQGPGSNLLFRRIAQDFATIGVTARQVEPGRGADLDLYDSVARYASPRWFLNQFNCTIRTGPCSPKADALVEQSLTAASPDQKAALLAQATLELQDANAFISFGAPIRWSLVRSSVTGFAENQWGLHPLFPLSEMPN